MTQKDPVCVWEVPAIAATMANMQERAFVIIFGSLLFCAEERCVDLYIVVVTLKDAIFS